MKILYLFVYILGLFFSAEVVTPPERKPQYVYTVPPGFSQLADLERNGLLSFADNFGNGLDIYIEYTDLEDEIQEVRRQYKDEILEEKHIAGNTVIFRIESHEIIYPIYSVILYEKADFTVYAIWLTEADSSNRDEFEEKALTLLESLAEGGRDVSLQKSITDGSSDGAVPLGQFGEG